MVPNPDAQVGDRQTSYSNCNTASRATNPEPDRSEQKAPGSGWRPAVSESAQQSASQRHEGGKTRPPERWRVEAWSAGPWCC